MEENSDIKVTDYEILRNEKVEECRKNLKGYPDLIARSFEAAESAKKDNGNGPKPNTDSVIGEGQTDFIAIKKDGGHLKVLQYNILADGKMNQVLVTSSLVSSCFFTIDTERRETGEKHPSHYTG